MSLVTLTARAALLAFLGLTWAGLLACRERVAAAERPAPSFPTAEPEAWIGPPQSLEALRGKVVLLDVWTFG